MTTEEKALIELLESDKAGLRASLLLQGSPARKGFPLTYDISRAHAIEAICRAIEAHEADKKAFSDAVKRVLTVKDRGQETAAWRWLSPFILTDPEPDPLVEAIREMALSDATKADADRLRQALAARGYKIERIDHD